MRKILMKFCRFTAWKNKRSSKLTSILLGEELVVSEVLLGQAYFFLSIVNQIAFMLKYKWNALNQRVRRDFEIKIIDRQRQKIGLTRVRAIRITTAIEHQLVLLY